MKGKLDDKQERLNPPFPTTCRECGGVLDRIETYPLVYDIFTGEVRTYKYTYACRKDWKHVKLIVIDNPKANFRAVIREDKWNEDRAKARGQKPKKA